MLPRVTRDWVDETVFIIAGGPSVRGVDLARLRGHRVVVINSSYMVYPQADALVFTDRRWWIEHQHRVRQIFDGQIVTLTPRDRMYDGLLVLERQRSGGMSTDPTRLAWWHTTLTTALNYVALRGATRIPVLGLDGANSGADGAMWHHTPHPIRWGANWNRYKYHGEALEAIAGPLLAQGARVYNLNPDSAHKMFQFASLDDFAPQVQMEMFT